MSRSPLHSQHDPSVPFLVIEFPDGTDRIYAIPDSGLTIGSSPGNPLYVPDMDLAPRHAEVVPVEDGGIEIIDLDSGYGTYVNGLSIRRSSLEDGEEVWFGEVRARFYAGQRGLVGVSTVRRAPTGLDEDSPLVALAADGPELILGDDAGLQAGWAELRAAQEQWRRDRLQFETAKRKHLEKERLLFETGEPRVLLETSRQELRRLKHRSDEFSLELESKRQERTALEADLARLQNAISEAGSDRDKVLAEVHEWRSERSHSKEALSSLAKLSGRAKLEWSAQLDQLRQAASAEERRFTGLIAKRDGLRIEVANIQRELAEAKSARNELHQAVQIEREAIERSRLGRLLEIDVELESQRQELSRQSEQLAYGRLELAEVESARDQALAATEALRSEAERIRSAMIQHSETVAGLDVRAGELQASVVGLQRKEQALVERLQMLHRQQLRVENPAG